MTHLAKAFLATLFAGVLCCGAVLAQSSAVSEQTLKAVLFFKLPMFVYHGDEGRKPSVLRFCVLGASLLDSALKSLAEQGNTEGPVEFRNVADAKSAKACDFLFIGRSESNKLDSTLQALDAAHVVTVSDIQGFAHTGGMVELALRPGGSGLQILINRRAGRDAGIEFNAQLLRLADIVEE